MRTPIIDILQRVTDLKARLDETEDEADQYRIASKLRRIMTTYIHLEEELMEDDADVIH